jgi:hypothetical protein
MRKLKNKKKTILINRTKIKKKKEGKNILQ